MSAGSNPVAAGSIIFGSADSRSAAIAATRKFRPCPLRDDGGQPVTHLRVGAILRPGSAGPGLGHPVPGEQRGGELAQAVEVEVGVAVEVDEIVIARGWSRRARPAARPGA